MKDTESPLGPRPKLLPIAPKAAPGRRHLPLAQGARPVDQYWRPLYAVWELTLQCDLACRHCGSRAGRSRPDELDTRESLDLVDQMHAMGVKEVTLIGGEAYLRKDWLVIAKAIADKGMELTMTTGGRNLDDEKARAMKAVGFRSVSVSIDGLEPMHDALRGVKGSWKAAFRALKSLKAAGIPVSVNTQITRPGLTQIEDTFDLLVQAGVHAWQVSQTVPMGRAADEPDLLLEPFQVLETMAVLYRIKKKADAARVRIWPGNDIGYFGPYETMLRGNMPRGHMSSCGAGRMTLGIEANGAIKGCPSLPTREYTGGNLRDETLKDIWERSEPLRFTRERTVEDLWGFCRTCYYAEDCLAGCSWTSHVFLGRIGNNPFCHHRTLELLREGKRERMVLKTAAPGEPFDYGIFEIVVEDWPADELARARELVATPEGFLLHTERAQAGIRARFEARAQDLPDSVDYD
ncbi:MAG: radical SAM protein [Deltaproteobacteria bacterium]|nr:radical SAM protein [Deltaproteobacteria bacterium]